MRKFQILVVCTVKVCKRYLQTVSVSRSQTAASGISLVQQTSSIAYQFNPSLSPSSSPSSYSDHEPLVGSSRGVFQSHLRTFLCQSFPSYPLGWSGNMITCCLAVTASGSKCSGLSQPSYVFSAHYNIFIFTYLVILHFYKYLLDLNPVNYLCRNDTN